MKKTATTTTTTAPERSNWQIFHGFRESVEWVRGIATNDAAYGIGFVENKLSSVTVDVDGVTAEPITIKAAADQMSRFLDLEIHLRCDILGTDPGLIKWHNAIIALADGQLEGPVKPVIAVTLEHDMFGLVVARSAAEKIGLGEGLRAFLEQSKIHAEMCDWASNVGKSKAA